LQRCRQHEVLQRNTLRLCGARKQRRRGVTACLLYERLLLFRLSRAVMLQAPLRRGAALKSQARPQMQHDISLRVLNKASGCQQRFHCRDSRHCRLWTIRDHVRKLVATQ